MKSDHPSLPMTPQELSETAIACRKQKAAMLHLHVRAEDGTHSLDPSLYRVAIAEIRAAVQEDIVIQITTESAGRYDCFEQATVLRTVHPEAASLAIRDWIANDDTVMELALLLQWCKEHRVFLQYILYDSEDVRRFTKLYHKGMILDRHPFGLFVLGRYDDPMPCHPMALYDFLVPWQEGIGNAPWALCAFGPHENRWALAAAALGGHVRVGFENNLSLPDGKIAESNAELVALAERGIALTGRTLATPKDILLLRDTWKG